MAYRTDIPDDVFVDVITSSDSYAAAAKRLNTSLSTIRFAAKRLSITTKGCNKKHGNGKKCDANYVRERYLTNKIAISSTQLRYLILKTGIKEHRCESCGLTTWLDGPIPLELHHINGNHNDNIESNLMILCPTCHAYITNKNKEASRNKKKEKKKQKEFKINITASELLALFEENQSYSKVGHILHVSDRTIKNYCIRLGIDDEARSIAYLNRAKLIKEHIKPITAEQRKQRSQQRVERCYGIDKKVIGQFSKDGVLLQKFDALYQIEDLGFGRSHVRECCQGKRKFHKGYKWSYIDPL